VDAALASSSDVQVNIPVVAVNDAPVVANPVPDASVAVGSSLNFTVASNAFTDIDSAVLTYSATQANGSALPAWLSFNAATRTFTGMPVSGDNGTVSVKVTASDGSLSASDTFSLSVAGVMAGGAGNDRIQGTLNDDQVDGGPGLDGFVVNATRTSTQVERLGSDTVQLKGPNGKDSLKNVERILFTDSALAFDLSGNAGTVARILGSVFGPGAISNKEYAGIGLQLIDAGMGYEALMNLALDAALGASRSDMAVVQLLYRNLVGSVPTSGDAAYFVGLITSGAYSQVGLAQYAASLTLTEERINLIGLAQSGLAYTPPDGG
jgi:hypothetical protein